MRALWWIVLCGCGSSSGRVPPGSTVDSPPPEVTAERDDSVAPTNVLFVLLDDVGTDKIGTYAEHPTAPRMPTFDRLADEGVLFRNAYAYPICSPTRAALLTGRRARRTGMGENFQGQTTGELPLNELLIPEMLQLGEVPWDTAIVGKWHLTHPLEPDALTHPLRSGFARHQGTFSNPGFTFDPSLQPAGYDRWEYLEDGVLSVQDSYLTSFMIDRALEQTQQLREPWFLYLAVQAPHDPWSAPPDGLLVEPLGPDPTQAELYAATLQALDAELGRLLSSMDPELLARTTVVVMGDNGTPGPVIEEPADPAQGKLTLFEGGVNVPLVVWSPWINAPGREVEDLVDVHDWFPTIAELAGIDTAGLTREDGTPATLDGTSLLPLLHSPTASLDRGWIVAERFGPPGPGPYNNERRAVIERDWKLAELHLTDGDVLALFDLRDRFDDGPNLLEDQPMEAEAWEALIRLWNRMRQDDQMPYEGP